MTFLNPFILIGLVASSIPIILHLLNLRKLRKIEFSSLIFLKELQKNKIRKIKVKQILLLILRTLIIAFLVFCFSRPVMKGYLSGFGSHAKTSVVIVIDDSYSMNMNDENGNYLKQAKESAAGIIDLMEEGDDISVIRTSQLPLVPIKSSQNFINAKNEIFKFTNGYKFSAVYSSLILSSQILSESKNYNKEIYIITDNQKVNYKIKDGEKISSRLFDNNTRLYVINIGNKNINSTAITGVELVNRIFEKENPVNLKVTLKNNSTEKLQDRLLSIYIDGKRVSQKNLNLDFGSVITDISFVPHKTGFIEGYAELEDDELSIDNRYYFSFYIPEKLNILLTGTDESDYEFIKMALTSFSNDSVKNGSGTIFNITTKRNSSFASTNLAGFDAIMVFGAGGLSSGDLGRIKSFLGTGGGMIFYPGKNNDLNSTNQFFNYFGISPSSGLTQNESSFLSFSKVDYDHPLFQGIFENKFGTGTKKEIESPQIFKSLNLSDTKNAGSVIELSNNHPFLLDYSYEKSKILLFSVNPGQEWSDYPFKGIFIPITYKAVFYVSNKFESGSSIIVGDNVDINLKITGNSAGTILKSPNGEEEKVSLNQTPSGYYYNFSDSKEPGIYSFINSGELIKTIPVNLSPEESDPEKISSKDLESFVQLLSMKDRYKYLDKSSNISTFLQEARYGVELWKEFLILALILIIFEMLISKDSKKELAEVMDNK
jgi:hypothetical protein